MFLPCFYCLQVTSLLKSLLLLFSHLKTGETSLAELGLTARLAQSQETSEFDSSDSHVPAMLDEFESRASLEPLVK